MKSASRSANSTFAPRARRNSAAQTHSTTQIKNIFPPDDLRRADEHLPNALAAFPQLGPVRKVQFLPFMPLSSYSLTPILLGRYLVKHDIRIGDSREGNLQFANCSVCVLV